MEVVTHGDGRSCSRALPVGGRWEPGAQPLLVELKSPSLQDNGIDLIQWHMCEAGGQVLGIQAGGRDWGWPHGPGHRKLLFWGSSGSSSLHHCGQIGKIRVAQRNLWSVLWRGEVVWHCWCVRSAWQRLLAFTSSGGSEGRALWNELDHPSPVPTGGKRQLRAPVPSARLQTWGGWRRRLTHSWGGTISF